MSTNKDINDDVTQAILNKSNDGAMLPISVLLVSLSIPLIMYGLAEIAFAILTFIY